MKPLFHPEALLTGGCCCGSELFVHSECWTGFSSWPCPTDHKGEQQETPSKHPQMALDISHILRNMSCSGRAKASSKVYGARGSQGR